MSQDVVIFEDESITYINNDLSLIEKKHSQPFSTDAYLLYAYIRKSRYANAVELGAGSGVISLLCITGGKIAHSCMVEIQKNVADTAARNISLNSLSDKAEVFNMDLREISGADFGSVDIVFTNPPYMKCKSGATAQSEMRGISRHELNGDIDDFCKASSQILKFGGLFYVVYRPDRLSDLFFSMRRWGIEPKKIQYVHKDAESAPSIVLVEGKRGAASGLFTAPPLFIYKDKSHNEESEDYRYIYDNGDFNERFRKH